MVLGSGPAERPGDRPGPPGAPCPRRDSLVIAAPADMTVGESAPGRPLCNWGKMHKIEHVDQIESRQIRQLFLYWQSKCGSDGRIPRRADVDPAEIPRLVPNILIVDVEYNPFRVRYRLVGTKVVQATGFEITGKYLDEIVLADDEGPFLESYQTCCATRAPILTRIKWHLDAETTGEYDACFLPLSEDGETVNKVLSMECYESIEREFTFLGRRGFQRVPKKRDD